jgi:cytochrome c
MLKLCVFCLNDCGCANAHATCGRVLSGHTIGNARCVRQIHKGKTPVIIPRILILTRTLTLISVCATPLALMGPVAQAATPQAIASGAYCSNCHVKDKKLIGPSFHDIAAKYAADPKAAAVLAAKVRSGGKGVWGPVPMPPSGDKIISDADLSVLLAWILKQ